MAEISRPRTPKFHLSRLCWTGLISLAAGSGPLLVIILLASLGLTKDPNPNPVGFGILAGFTFWPSLGLTAWGGVRSYSRYKSAQER